MNFDLSEDQEAIRRTAQELLAERYPLAEVRRLALSDERGFTDAQWAEMAGLGWPGIAIPEALGGQGLGVVELAVVAEELGHALAPCPLQSTWAAGLLLAAAGRHPLLGALAAGDAKGTAAPELSAVPDAGVAGQPTGRRSGGEEPAVADSGLSGIWSAVSDAGVADVLVVATDKGWLVVEAGAPGLTLEPAKGIDPTRRLFTVRLDGAAGAELTGDLSRARDAIAVAWAAESVGVAQRALDMAVAYAKERRQFDRPIGTYQAVSHACAQMLLEVEGARSVVHWAAWALDHEPEAAPAAAAAAKAYASDCGVRVCGAALQVHGGIGFTWEHDLHFLLKRARGNAAAWGHARAQRDRVADLVGLTAGA